MSSPLATSVINKRSVPGDRYYAQVTLTLPSAYPTNGFDVTAVGLFGFNFAVDSVNCASATSAGKPVFYDKANGKIKVFSAIGTEVSLNTDLSAETLNVDARGY